MNTTLKFRNGLAAELATAERHLQEFLAASARYVFAPGPVAPIERQAGTAGK